MCGAGRPGAAEDKLETTVLQRSRARASSGQGGFTLVELLVVIVILGILAAVVVFAVGGINDKGQTSACKADKSSLSNAEERYYVDNQAYGTMAELAAGGKYIHEASTLHTISGTPAGYTLTPVGDCA